MLKVEGQVAMEKVYEGRENYTDIQERKNGQWDRRCRLEFMRKQAQAKLTCVSLSLSLTLLESERVDQSRSDKWRWVGLEGMNLWR